MNSTGWRDWSCQVRVTLAGGTDDLASASRIVRGVMDDVSLSVSRFRSDSDLARVNAAAGRLVPVRPLTLEMVDIAVAAARRTNGAVDPTIGSHLLAAGYVVDIDVLRGRSQVAATAAGRRADWTAVVLDRTTGRVGIPVDLQLDLGATAKAWAADEAARRVHARLGLAVLVEIGGDLAVAGAPPRPWRIDVAEVAGGPARRVDLSHGAIATSSVLARTWTSTRGREHHLIDPGTSRPVRGSLRSATVWAASAVEANTWSTAALVWGGAAVTRLRAAGVDARLVDTAGEVIVVGAWPVDERVVA